MYVWNVLMVVVLLLGSLPGAGLLQAALPAHPAADSDITVEYIGSHVANDGSESGGTPNAAYVSIANLTAGGTYRIKAYKGGDGYWNWNDTTNSWVGTATSDQRPIVADSSGTWEGWVFFKLNTTLIGGVGFRVFEGASGTTQFGTKYSSDVTFMDMATGGGWIEGTVYDTGGAPLANAPVVVRDSSNAILGIYLSEDNAVSEGYSATTGYYKVPAPAGSDYTVEVWDASNAIVGLPATGVSVTAGASTSGVNVNEGGVNTLMTSKSGPASVEYGERFTYTLALKNSTGITLTNLTISDTLPISATYAASDPAGTWNGTTLTWTAATLVDAGALTYTIAVTAPETVAALVNEEYAAWASNWMTPSTGSAVQTDVVPPLGTITPIGTARGLNGQTVTVAGRATMYTGGFYAGSNAKFYVQDSSGGISVIAFASNGTLPQVTLGDLVTVTGEIGAYNGEIQIAPADNTTDVQIQHGDPADVPAPLDKAISEVDDDVNALGWLVQTQGEVITATEYTYSYEILLSDGMGNTALVYVDKNTGIVPDVRVGATYRVTGISELYNTTYQIKPRIQSDIVEIPPTAVRLQKEGPDTVLQGYPYSYTLIATNNMSVSLSNVVITDAYPTTNAALGQIVDGGVVVGDEIHWTIPAMAVGEQVSVSFTMTPTGAVGTHIVNDTFGISANETITREIWAGVDTVISSGCTPGYTPAYEIQGEGFESTYKGQNVTTCGVVVGIFEGNSSEVGNFDGFYIQDLFGDSLTTTSDAIFVNHGGTDMTVAEGDLVEVTGTVHEFSEWDGTACTVSGGDHCLTEVSVDVANVDVMGTSPIAVEPVVVDPPTGDSAAALAYWESLEGMDVTIPSTATVVGPTSYGTIMVVPGDLGIERVMRSGPYAGTPVGVRFYNLFGSGAPNLVVGSVVDDVDGPLAYTYGNYVIVTQPSDDWNVVYSEPVPATAPEWPSASSGEFSAATFNTLNFDETSGTKMGKVVETILSLGCPTFLSLQELEMDATLPALRTELQNQGCTYNSANSHEDVGNHGVAVLWRTDRVTNVEWSTQYQGCSAYGSSSSTAYDPYCAGTGLYPLFSRRPVVVTGTVSYNGSQEQVVVIGNHFKSKRGGLEADYRRLGQAQLVADIVDDIVVNVPHVLVMGDLNDFEDSAPLNALHASGSLTTTWNHVPAGEQYSYIYQGMSQILDHVLASPTLMARLVDVAPLHYNADFPYSYSSTPGVVWRTSDHDLIAATFSLSATLAPQVEVYKTVAPESSLYRYDTVTYTMALYNVGDSLAEGIELVDALPAGVTFGGWVEQGAATYANGTITWTGSLSATSSTALVFTATVVEENSSLWAVPVTNTVMVSSTNAGSDSDYAVFTLEQLVPFLAVSKEVTPALDLYRNDVITYTVMAENVGEGTANDVVLTDTLPTGIDFGGWVVQDTATYANGTLNWTGDVGSETPTVLVFTATVSAENQSQGVVITNTVSATSSNAGSDSAAAPVTLKALVPILGVTKAITPTADLYYGDVVTYTIVASNDGEGTAHGVVLSDTLPAGVDFGGWVMQDTATYANGEIGWTGDIGSETPTVLIFTATVAAENSMLLAVPVTNTVTATSLDAGYASDDATFTLKALVPVLGLAKAVTPTAELYRGDVVTYTLIASNDGEGTAYNVLLTDTIPTGIDFGGWVTQGSATYANGEITWSGNVGSETPLALIFTVTVTAENQQQSVPVTNTVTATSLDAGSASDTAIFTLKGLVPVLNLTKEVLPDSGIAQGDVVTYTIVAANDGEGAAHDVVLTDTLPTGIDFGGWVTQGSATYANGVITWAGDVGSETPTVLIFTATVTAENQEQSLPITNTVTATSLDAGADSAAVVLTLSSLGPDLAIAKAVMPDSGVALGDSVTYTLTLTNGGLSAASGVMLTDTLPTALDFGGWVTTAPSGTVVMDDVILWSGDVLSNSMLTFVFTATLRSDAGVTAGAMVTNTVVFDAGTVGQGEASAIFTVGDLYKIFLPLIAKNYGQP